MRSGHGYGVTAFILAISSPYVEALLFCSAANVFWRQSHDGGYLGAKSHAYGARWRHVRRICVRGLAWVTDKALYRSCNGTITRTLTFRSALLFFTVSPQIVDGSDALDV
jgi:hypothetical protein